MKKPKIWLLLSLIVPFIGIGNALAISTTKPANPSVLTILTWPEYFAPEVLQSFESQYQAKVHQVYFESEEVRNKLVALEGLGQYDIAVVGHDSVENYANVGWIAQLEAEKLPNLSLMDASFDIPGVTGKFAVLPFFEGYSGIVYRTDLVEGRIDSWRSIFGYEPALQQKFVMVQDPAELIATALIMLGQTDLLLSDEIPVDARSVLRQQSRNLFDYGYISADPEESQLLNGDIYAAYAYTGDGQLLMELSQDVDFVIPKEGCLIFRDYFVLFNAAPNKDLAYQFLNYMASTETSLLSTRYSGYVPPNKNVLKHLSEAELNNTRRFPKKDILDKCHLIPKVSAKLFRKWSAFKQELLETR